MLDIDEIHGQWAVDCVINTLDIKDESTKIAKLHSKYAKMLTDAGLRIKWLTSEYKKIHVLKTEYYLGQMDNDQLKTVGWKPWPLKILRQDLEMYIAADQQVIELTLKIGYQQEAAQLLESILKMIHTRSFQIKNFIDWSRFVAGG